MPRSDDMLRRLHLSLTTLLQLLVLVTVSLAAAATVSAAPITVTGGIVVVNGEFFGPSATANLMGPNFSTNPLTDSGGADHFGYFGIAPCSRSIGGLNGPCTGASLSYNGTGEWRGPVAFNGIFFNSDVVNNLNLTITSPSWVIPAEFLDDAAVLITAPFTLTGFGAGPVLGLQTIELVGEGTVRLLLTRQTVGGFTGLFLDRADYTLGSTVSGVTIESVPEPASMMLLLSGLAATAFGVRKHTRGLVKK
jgi:PEP-CTERM motif